MKFKSGDLVKGKKAEILGKRGRIVSIDDSSRSVKNRVMWDDGTEGEYFSKAIEISRRDADVQPTQPVSNQSSNSSTRPLTNVHMGHEDNSGEENGSEDSESDSETESQFGDREAANELHPEDGLPALTPHTGGTLQML